MGRVEERDSAGQEGRETRERRQARHRVVVGRKQAWPVDSAVVLVAADTAHCFCWPKYICPLEGPADAGAV